MREFFKKMEQLKSKKNDALRRSIVLLLVGVCLLVILWPADSEDEDTFENSKSEYDEQNTSENTEDNAFTYDEYVSFLENRLENILTGVKGVGNADVMITLKDSGEKIVEKDITNEESQAEDSNRVSSSEETVTVNNDDGTAPYVSKVLEPEIEGVVIACEGGGNSEIAIKITEVVQALFDVPAHKIVVLEQK